MIRISIAHFVGFEILFFNAIVAYVRWHFFVFRNLEETLCVSWALPFVECVTVWALKLPVPHTDVLKTHLSQSVSSKLLEFKGIGSKHMPQSHLKKRTSFFLYFCQHEQLKSADYPTGNFFTGRPGWLCHEVIP